MVADRLRNTHDYVVNGNTDYKPDDLISLSSNIPHIESLMSELTTPRRDFDKAGRVKVESKDDLKTAPYTHLTLPTTPYVYTAVVSLTIKQTFNRRKRTQ